MSDVVPLPSCDKGSKWSRGIDVHNVQWTTTMDGYLLTARYINNKGLVSCVFEVSRESEAFDVHITGEAVSPSDAKRRCLEAVALLKLIDG